MKEKNGDLSTWPIKHQDSWSTNTKHRRQSSALGFYKEKTRGEYGTDPGKEGKHEPSPSSIFNRADEREFF